MTRPTKAEVRQALNGLAVLTRHMTADEYKALQPAPRTTRRHLEADEQMAVIAWCRAQGYPYDRIYAIENERKTLTPQQAGRRAKMGVRAGVCDLALDVAKGGYHGLKIEMKSAKGRVSDLQQMYIDEVRREGYAAVVCHSADEAIKVLRDYCEQ